MDFSNINEALKEAAMDIKEGADILLVNLESCILDVLKEIKNQILNFQHLAIRYLESTL